MKIRNVVHKGLRRLIEEDEAGGLPAASVSKLRRILSFLQDMEREEELRTIPSWKAHRLTGDRKGTWSLSVTKNWRLTFRSTKVRWKSSTSTTKTITEASRAGCPIRLEFG